MSLGIILFLLTPPEMSSKPCPAEVTITAEPESTSHQQRGVLVIRLTNRGKTKAWLNQRMMVNTRYSAPGFREVWLDIVDPKGERIPFQCFRDGDVASPKNYAAIAPGQSIEVREDVARCHRLEPGVRYSITAHYDDDNPERPPAPPNTCSVTAAQSKVVVLVGPERRRRRERRPPGRGGDARGRRGVRPPSACYV
jgi:hypothetical protein